jgi:transposase-like protein
MIVEKSVRRCPHCESESLRKNGHTNYGAQRAQCRECGKTFVLASKPPRYPAAERERILSAHVRERLSRRAATRLFGVAYGTLKSWLGKKSG